MQNEDKLDNCFLAKIRSSSSNSSSLVVTIPSWLIRINKIQRGDFLKLKLIEIEYKGDKTAWH
jgi:hypothetical protein